MVVQICLSLAAFITSFWKSITWQAWKRPSKFQAYIRNTIPAKSFWTPSEESPLPLLLFQCCSNDVDFSFNFFRTCKTTLVRGYGGKRNPLSNVIVWDSSSTLFLPRILYSQARAQTLLTPCAVFCLIAILGVSSSTVINGFVESEECGKNGLRSVENAGCGK